MTHHSTRRLSRRLGAALGIWLQGHGTEPVRTLLGHDGRVSAPWIEQALAAGLATSEVGTVTLGLTTDPRRWPT